MSRISSRELTEWMAYERLTGPLGSQRDDIHVAMLAERVTNAMSSGKGRRPTVDDFLPKWGQRREELGGDDQEPADQAGDPR